MPFPARIPFFWMGPVIPVVFFAACAPRSVSPLQASFSKGKPYYRVEVDSLGRKHGAERWWFETGNPRYSADNVHGRRHGVYQAWYTDGSPWYKGRDSLGVAVDTLFAWRPNGRLQLIRVFEAGETVSYEAVDTSGVTRAERIRLDALDAGKARDSAGVLETARRAALSEWAKRVRATVETYWIPPRSKGSRGLQAHRAVATLRVGADGRVLNVGWAERSASRAFNEKADKALRRIKKLPPLPAEAAGQPIELRYEFVSAGSSTRRARPFAPADTSGAETSLD